MPNVEVIIDETARGCGLRKSGGLYLMADDFGVPCGKLPLPIGACPTCGCGIKPARAWTWIDPRPLAAAKACEFSFVNCRHCNLNNPPERVGLLWIGEEHYATVEAFETEVSKQGISRRISKVPREFVLGETWVWLAHRKAISEVCGECDGKYSNLDATESKMELCEHCDEGRQYTAAIFRTFKPQRIEYIVNGKESDAELNSIEKRGIKLVKLERTAKAKAGEI
jgi:hypothetical protein